MSSDISLAGLVIDGGVLIIAAIAAIIAWKQAKTAIEAKDETAELLQAARDSAEAAGRSAGALERTADVAERGEQRDPWQVRRLSAHRWSVTNVSGLNLDFATLESSPAGVIHIEGGSAHRDVPNGTSVYFGFGGGVADPSSANVTVKWRSPISRMQEEFHFSIP